MEVTGDELAGIVDLFGALTHEELGQALAELAYKHGEEYDTDAFDGDISQALDQYRLEALAADNVDGAVDKEGVLVAGPVAFPELPDGATDLVHILDIDERQVDRDAAGQAALERFREDAATAIDAGDERRRERLVDVSYELEAWASVDLAAEREKLQQ